MRRAPLEPRDGRREAVPGGAARGGEVVEAEAFLFPAPEDLGGRVGEDAGERRRADLIGDDAHLVLLPQKPSHRKEEILAACRVAPARSQDQVRAKNFFLTMRRLLREK